MIRKLHILLLVAAIGLIGSCSRSQTAETWRMMEFMLNQL